MYRNPKLLVKTFKNKIVSFFLKRKDGQMLHF